MKYKTGALIAVILFLGMIRMAHSSNQYYLSFDGNDYVKYTDDELLGRMDGASNYTIEAWIYPDTNVATYDRVFQRYYSFNIVIWHIDAEKDSSDWYFTAWDDGGTSHYFNAKKSIAFNTWNHLAVINNSTEGSLKLYVNGEEVTTQSYSNMDLRASHSSDNFYVGQLGNGSDFFNGFVDEVRLKNTAENPDDLIEDHNQNYTSDENTALLLHFDEGTGSMTQNAVTAEGDSARLGGTDVGDAAEPTWIEWIPSAISDVKKSLPGTFVLHQNYPNPFNPSTTISYQLFTAGHVEITVYNGLGERIAQLVDVQQPVGNYEVQFDASKLNSGIYFTRFSLNGKTAVQKMMLIK